MKSALGNGDSQHNITSGLQHLCQTPNKRARNISNLKDPTLPTSIWNQPFDGPKTLRIGVLKIVDSKVKIRTDDEVIQTSHHYAKTKQYFVEQIFANSDLKSYSFPRNIEIDKSPKDSNLVRKNSNLLINKFYYHLNKKQKSTNLTSSNKEINTLSIDRINGVMQSSRFSFGKPTQKWRNSSNSITLNKKKDNENTPRPANQSAVMKLESLKPELTSSLQDQNFMRVYDKGFTLMQQSNSHSNLYGDELFKSNIEDAKTSTHKKNKLTEPLDSFTSARSRGDYHKTDMVKSVFYPDINEDFKIDCELSESTSVEDLKSNEFKYKRKDFNHNRIMKSSRKLKDSSKFYNKNIYQNSPSKCADRNSLYMKRPAKNLAKTNTTNMSISTKDSNISSTKAPKSATAQKSLPENKKTEKRNAYVPVKLKPHSLEEKINSLLYKDSTSCTQANSQNVKLFSKLKKAGVDIAKLQKTIKLLK